MASSSSAGSIWHDAGVASAVAKVRDAGSLLVVLTTHVVAPVNPSADDVLAKSSSRALENITFASQNVRSALSLHNAVCLRLRGAPDDVDFANFNALFKVEHTPSIHVIAPDGRVLLARPYFTSPLALVRAFDSAAHARDNLLEKHMQHSVDLGPELHPRRPLPRTKTRTKPPVAKKAGAGPSKPAVAKASVSPAARTPRSTDSRVNATCAATVSPDTERSLPSSFGAMQLGTRTRLQLRLAGGRSATRSFDVSVPFRDVRAWAAEELGVPGAGDSVQLAVAFPRHVFDAADGPKTLRELGLLPSATLIVTRTATSPVRGVLASVSAGGSLLRSAVGAAGSFLGAFVSGEAPQQSQDQQSQQHHDGTDPVDRSSNRGS